MNESIMVSVCMIAYNIEHFIGEAIESVLSQHTTFPVQLVIGEDVSPDKTREICIAYKEKYPHRIKLLLHEKNLGLTANSIATQNACDGKYVAMCDGDDYWTDSNKLQTQIDFLESNPEYAGCGHQATVIYDDKSRNPHNFRGYVESDLYLKDMVELRKFHTSSLVYRKEIWNKHGGIPPNIHANERAMYLMIATEGKIRYFNKAMCTYRLSSIGISSRVTPKILKQDLNIIPWIKRINSEFPAGQFRSYVYYTMFTYPNKVKIIELFKYYILFAIYSFSYFPHNIKRVFRAFRKDVLKKLI
jgi:glycosyltransferase involved in cell wall biosynthesis